MSDLVPFDYSGREVRTVLVDDEPWFVALDVCAVLGIRNASDAVRGLDVDEVGTTEVIDATGRAQQVRTISEPGLYALLARSRRPEARPFRRWVNHEVLPTVRRTGSYSLAPQSQIDIIIASAMEMKRIAEQVERTAAAVIEAGQEAAVANARIDAIEGRHDWFSALGYAKTCGLPTDSVSLARFGKLAATIARSEGVEPNKVQHAHFGAVNEFPVHVWDRAASALRGKSA